MNLKKLQNLPNTFAGKLLNLVFLFGGYAPLAPRFVELLPTYRCNLRCEFCYQAPEKRDRYPDLTLAGARRIEENLRRSFRHRPRIHLFGGEPTVNRDFMEIVRLFAGCGYRLSLTTNGVELGKYLAGLQAVRQLKEINISLNTLDINNALKLAGQLGHIKININCPINRSNQKELTRIAAALAGGRVNSLTFQHATFAKSAPPDIDPEVVAEQVKGLKSKRAGFPILFLPEIKPGDIKKYYTDPAFPYKDKCVFPWFVLFIQPNGDIIPCDEVDEKMGNALTEDLAAIWNNGKYRRFRAGIIKKGVSAPICFRCCHRQYY
ncbi:MAG: radical SAM protein [Candidatus Saganbacteria bacterium]|nr:radical SAM protein [Candidatus Saganbacteria bacterium]